MGSHRIRYVASNDPAQDEEQLDGEYLADLVRTREQYRPEPRDVGDIGVTNMPHEAFSASTCREMWDDWEELKDVSQHNSLILALMEAKDRK